ncbi:uncharacterized protein LOC143286688 [Babylonia areolata]|uniref:uncharacterized protein LOC143286688 n=1 Tax=Babylonia areolata TaxID=304850 RepID=UPI003FD3DEAA
MWTKGVNVLLVVMAVALMTSDPVEAWGRRVWRTVKSAAVNYAASKAVGAAVAAVGKRGVEGAPAAGLTQEEVGEVVQQMVTECSGLPVDPARVGLTSAAMGLQFKKLDTDGDDSLKGKELENFADYIETFAACANVEDDIED